MNKRKLLVIASSLYCGCLLVSNIIAGKTFDAGVTSLPCAVIIFPMVYILNDLLTEIYGFRKARMIVFTGFAVNLVAVAAYELTIILPCSAFFSSQDAYATVLGSTPRVLLASLSAYVFGSLLNAKVMEKMKERWETALMARCIGSTLLGESVDALLFITIAFACTMPVPALLGMIASQAAFKTLYELVVYPITRTVIKWARELPEG